MLAVTLENMGIAREGPAPSPELKPLTPAPRATSAQARLQAYHEAQNPPQDRSENELRRLQRQIESGVALSPTDRLALFQLTHETAPASPIPPRAVPPPRAPLTQEQLSQMQAANDAKREVERLTKAYHTELTNVSLLQRHGAPDKSFLAQERADKIHAELHRLRAKAKV
jgi:hypothetical protein